MLSKHCLPTLPNLSEAFLSFSPTVERIFHILFRSLSDAGRDSGEFEGGSCDLERSDSSVQREHAEKGQGHPRFDDRLERQAGTTAPFLVTESIRKTSVHHNF